MRGEGGAAPTPAVGRWIRVLAIFVVAGFAEGAYLAHLIAFVPGHLPELGIPDARVPVVTAIVVVVASAAGIPFVPFWGALADRYTRKPVIIRSFIAYLVSGVVMIFSDSLWLFLLGRCIVTLSLGNGGLMLTTVAEHTPRHRSAMAFAAAQAATPVGAFLGPLVGGFLVDAHGFRALLAFDTALVVCVILLLAFGYRDLEVTRDPRPVRSLAADSVRLIAGSPHLRGLFGALTVLYSGWLGAYALIPVLVESLYAGSDVGSAVGWTMAASGFATLVLAPTLGVLADRLGYMRLIYAGAAAQILSFLVGAAAGSLWQLAVAWALASGFAAGVYSISTLLLFQGAPEAARARVMSFSFLPLLGGLVVGPAVTGFVLRLGEVAVFPTAAAMTLLGIAAIRRATRLPVVSPPGPGGG